MAFQVIGHRGAAGHAPENTAPSFDLALRLGVDAIELDLQLSKDGVPVVVHDKTVDRVTDGSGEVNDLTAAELESLDAGSWFDAAYQGTRLVFLDELLARWAVRIPLVIEIKERVRYAELFRLLQDGLTRVNAQHITVSSFNIDALRAARAQCASTRLSWLFSPKDHPIETALSHGKELGLAELCPRATQVDSEWVARVHAEGFNVRAWGIPTQDAREMVRTMRRLVSAGVDGTTADFPDVMRSTLLACSAGKRA